MEAIETMSGCCTAMSELLIPHRTDRLIRIGAMRALEGCN